jgi:hypothetical protein
MRILEALVAAVLILFAILVLIFVRRAVIARGGGTIGMSMRLSRYVDGRGWAPGFGRFAGDELRWYRMFSLGLRPRRILSRQDLKVRRKRAPAGPERLVMPEGWIVVQCSRGPGKSGATGADIELGLAESALTGFLSWIESAPPRALRHR